MTYEDYRTHLLTCEYLNKEPTGKYKTIQSVLTDQWTDISFSILPDFKNYVTAHRQDRFIFAVCVLPGIFCGKIYWDSNTLSIMPPGSTQNLIPSHISDILDIPLTEYNHILSPGKFSTTHKNSVSDLLNSIPIPIPNPTDNDLPEMDGPWGCDSKYEPPV